ncbi:MAG: stage 0 sporulation family protein [Chloroflexi bacterium]|nr:stage 0 sporulation family protein [Chloroflexota bacterium]
MPEIVGIRFKRTGRLYYFDPNGLSLNIDDWVIVETTKGREIGRVILAPHQVEESELTEPLKPILQVADQASLEKMETFKAKEAEALQTCRQKVREHDLPMKLLDAEYNFDGSRLTFFFTAEGRVDFRQLVRDLASAFKTRVELRQVGVRDEARMIGGLGPCGRELCCASFLGDFINVSIKMAKEQDLPLSPNKISGMCGRLLCCLSYESQQYCEAKQRLPHLGDTVQTPEGCGRVVGLNIIKDSATVELPSGSTIELAVAEVKREPQPEGEARPAKKRRNRKGKRREEDSDD